MKQPESSYGRQQARLKVAAGLIESIVPDYDIKQSDPVLAAETGIGNCVSKAVVGGILLVRAQLIGPSPALAWNTRTHPKMGNDLIGRPRMLNGHAQLLVAPRSESKYIDALSFNPDGTAASNWEVFDFNDIGEFAAVDGDKIQATELGLASGFVIDSWYEAGKLYHEALGIEDSVYHSQSSEGITSRVIGALCAREFLLQFD